MKQAGLKTEPPLIIRQHTMDDDAQQIIAPVLKLLQPVHHDEIQRRPSDRSAAARGHAPSASESNRRQSYFQCPYPANLEPFRYGAVRFIQSCTQAISDIHRCNGLHLYPLAYWDWPLSPDKTDPALRQIDRDWIWFAAWARYAWNPYRDPVKEDLYWTDQIALRYGCSKETASLILDAYNQSGRCAPALLRRFGITNGNRQTLSLGMTLDQLVRPNHYNLFPRLTDSDSPEGERLQDFAEKEWKGLPHIGETPVQAMEEVLLASQKAADAMASAVGRVSQNKEELGRLKMTSTALAISRFYVLKA